MNKKFLGEMSDIDYFVQKVRRALNQTNITLESVRKPVEQLLLLLEAEKEYKNETN